ncbi:DUF397 domain-containing protein [Actinophytocola oryzae]|uniref:Uncharacterized protein DUF397 n=1 Tax=Actinophytocola oryzae TaxID=502181 RepID=A0A4V3FTN9_9PSEU|nr:DUF397 domain-containing protein [Actinophytocola oryzae]TDV52111.1 uncharacterized protein DUF397 [Actinophytocola oryzae]
MNIGTDWRKSSFSGENGSCVEVAFSDPAVGIRDSKSTRSGHLMVTQAEWVAFVVGVKGGRLGG